MKIQDIDENTDWGKYLEKLDVHLKSLGYRKFKQGRRGENFTYWKTSRHNEYQIGVYVYDWREELKYISFTKIQLSFECMILGESNEGCDLRVNRLIEVDQFEEMAKAFYQTMKEYL